MLKSRAPTGLTLLELLVALAVSLVVLAAASSVYLTALRLENDNLDLTRLTQDLRTMADAMSRDIRRAGFVSSDLSNQAALRDNPFFGAADIRVHWGGACIVYAYNRDDDVNGDGVSDEVPPVVDGNEYLGWRLNSGRLEMRQGGSSNADCDNGDWIALSGPGVEVTALSFALLTASLNASSMLSDRDGDGCMDGDDASPDSFSSACRSGSYGNGYCDAGEACTICSRDGSPDPACLQVRSVLFSLTARVAADPDVNQTLTQRVRLHNDKFLPALP